MAEKVLGYYAKDREFTSYFPQLTYYQKGKEIPVVSLEWLKERIENHNKKIIEFPKGCESALEQTQFIFGVNYEFEEFKKDLLLAAEKQASEKTK